MRKQDAGARKAKTGGSDRHASAAVAAPDEPAASLTLLDRDLGWLEFNHRVLALAVDPRTPLLERLKFLAIFSSNLDEFFMKRVNRLKTRVAAETSPTADGAYRQLVRVREALLPLLKTQANTFREIRAELAQLNIHLLSWAELSAGQQQIAREYFRRSVFPVLTPLAVDPAHPFPFLSNLSTSLGVLLRPPDSRDRLFARVKVPDVFPQWLPVSEAPANGQSPAPQSFVRLSDVIRNNLEDLFPGMVILEVMAFRITRNAEVEFDEDDETDSLVEMVEEELRQRRLEEAVRLEYSQPASATQLQLISHKLNLAEIDLYEVPEELDYTDLFAIAGLNRPDLRDPPWVPTVREDLDEDVDLFAAIRAGDILVHHPYESFDATVARFIRSAAEDPRVLALKMTVYRAGADTPFLDAMIRAAESGKQVACLVEVTARFDERQNLAVAHALEKVGVHVVYGVVGLKTHCKTTLVVRKDDDGIRCYAHIGTGNYHVKTARLYTDLGLFTCDPVLTGDVMDLFHYLTGRSAKKDYAKLLVAPVNMRSTFLGLVNREIEHKKAGRTARIIAKMNQLQDSAMCEALARASQAGVPVDLIVRGFCVLPPGVPGVTENIRIISVLGRFLEHSRIYYFQNGDEDPLAGSYYIGSADWMERNLSERVEAIAPIEARAHRQRLWDILQIMLADQRQAWDMQADGSYVERMPAANAGPESKGTHATMMELARRGAESEAAT
jgi:polyphosphate kinase